MNKFFNPDTCPFEAVGFYEELIDVETAKVHGWRIVKEPTRPIGSDGRVQLTLVEPTTLLKGTREVVVKASSKRPIKVWSMFQVICGKSKPTTKKQP